MTTFNLNKNSFSSSFDKLKKTHRMAFVVESNLSSRDYAGVWIKQPK